MFYNKNMGIISYFKTKFGKNIQPKGDISSHLVFVYKPRKGKIWLSTKLSVPQNFAFVLGKGGKVLDCFPSGEHELKAIYLPKSVKKFNLQKTKKDGSLPDSFVADAYFVNLNLFEYETFKTPKIDFFDSKYGYFKAGYHGAFAYQITNAEQFMKALLSVYDYIKQNEAVDILRGLICESVMEQLQKANMNFELCSNREYLTDFLFESLADKLKTIGVDLMGFMIEKIKFSSAFIKKVEKTTMLEQFENIDEPKPQPTTYFNVEPQQNKNQTLQQEESIVQHKDQIVDLEAVASYNEHNQFVRCMFCGAKNDKSSATCSLCGENIKKELL